MNNLRKLRKEKNLTLEELSNKLSAQGDSISKMQLSRYERGAQEPRLETWQTLADFFDVSMPHIMGFEIKSEEDLFEFNRMEVFTDIEELFNTSELHEKEILISWLEMINISFATLKGDDGLIQFNRMVTELFLLTKGTDTENIDGVPNKKIDYNAIVGRLNREITHYLDNENL